MNIFDAIYEINSKHPEKRAMSMAMNNGDRFIFTYGEVFREVEKYAALLLKSGIKAGDRIAIIAESSPWWSISFFACCKIRCTASLIDASLSGDDLAGYIERSDVRGAFFSENTYKKIKDKGVLNFPCFNVRDCGIFADSPTEVPSSLPDSTDTDEEIACIIFSSGTTRKAAGILHYHEGLIKTTVMTGEVQDINETSRFLGILPLSHIYGLFSLVLGPSVTGADVHFIESISADAMLGAFKEYKPTIFPGVPKVYELFRAAAMRKINSKSVTRLMFRKLFPICLKERQKSGKLLGKKFFSSIHETFGGELVRLFSGGAPLSQEVAEFYYGLGFNILSTYGASETNVPTLGNTEDDISLDSCGKPYPVVSAKISDEGELLIKSPFMMKGYFRDEAATKEAFTEDGWFRSGDLATEDNEGHIKIVGRSKENIVLATGKKVSPDDLEAKYTSVRGIKDFVICGVPAENGDYDEIHAFVVTENGTSRDEAEAEIKKINADVPHNMRIFKLHFVDDIPRTSLQKPKRYILKKQALDLRNGIIPEKKTVKAPADEISGLIGIISKISNVPTDEIGEDTKIFTDLAIDSLSAVDLAMEIENVYGVNVEGSYSKEMTVKELLHAVKTETKSDDSERSYGNYPYDKNQKDYMIFAAVRSFAKFCYKIRTVDQKNLPTEKGFIICPNHVTKIDFLFVSTALPKEKFMKMCCMAKIELFRKDIFSKQLIKSTGMCPVDRGGMNMNTMTSIKRKLREDWCVLIHPEGTRSEDGIFRDIKSGASVIAIDTGVPVVPVYINGAYELFPKNKKMIRFFDMKNKKRFNVDVVFGEPISSEGKSTEQLTNEIRDAILDLQAKYRK